MIRDAHHRGFTLIELVTTIVLLGILAVYALPKMDITIYGQRGFHDVLKGALQFARKAAIGKRRQVCVDVAGSTVSFSVVSTTPESGVAACPAATALTLPARDANCGAANQVCAPAGVVLTGSSFYFDAQGRASAGVIFGSTGQPNVTVTQETGYVY